jgi:hypothetical protein
MRHPADDLADEVGEPCLYTFTARLPFVLGIPDHLGHTMFWPGPYADPGDTELFGENVIVRIGVFAVTTPGLPLWPSGIHEAVAHFYEYELEGEPDTRVAEGALVAHDQWVTLETPSAPTVEDLARANPDPAFAFHRCLVGLNLFLRSALVATHDIRLRTISSHDLRPVVIVGARLRDGSWRFLSTLFMHPEALPDPLPPPAGPLTEAQLRGGIQAVLTQHPNVIPVIWRSRAQRAVRQTGDAADAIISFQIAAESLLFSIYRMILIDEGFSSAAVESQLEADRTFRSIVVTTMPTKLGGLWDITRPDTAVGEYWRRLYQVRNAIVHRGFEPHGGHAEAAQDAYRRLREHVEDRLVAKMRQYPRAVLARLGEEALSARGVLTHRMRRFINGLADEPGPWYWPYDVAGRDPPG